MLVLPGMPLVPVALTIYDGRDGYRPAIHYTTVCEGRHVFPTLARVGVIRDKQGRSLHGTYTTLLV